MAVALAKYALFLLILLHFSGDYSPFKVWDDSCFQPNSKNPAKPFWQKGHFSVLATTS